MKKDQGKGEKGAKGKKLKGAGGKRGNCKRSTDEPLLGGVHAPCSFYNFPSCPLLLSIFCPLLLFHLFPAHFSFFCAPCSFSIFPPAPCSFFKFSTAPCSFLPFLVLLARGLHLSASCSFTYSTACSLLLCVKQGFLPAMGLPLTGVQISVVVIITLTEGVSQFWEDIMCLRSNRVWNTSWGYV